MSVTGKKSFGLKSWINTPRWESLAAEKQARGSH